MESKSAESYVTASIPYVRGVSETVARILRPLGIRTVMQSQQRKWALMQGAKDRLPADTQPGVVYALGVQGLSKDLHWGDSEDGQKENGRAPTPRKKGKHRNVCSSATHAQQQPHHPFETSCGAKGEQHAKEKNSGSFDNPTPWCKNNQPRQRHKLE